MRTQPISIFDSWSTFPSIFLLPDIKESKQTLVKVDVRTFYLHPEKLLNESMVGLLRDRYGTGKNSTSNFNTNYISTNTTTSYNGYDFQLRVTNNEVILDITTDSYFHQGCSWKIKDIVRVLKSKNPRNRTINFKSVHLLFTNHKMKVKFNVTNSKDHGTKWVVIK